jgi:hypothetical protein
MTCEASANLSRSFKRIKHKFNAVRCERDGKKFPSLLERRYYDQLKIRQKAGDILFFLTQTRWDLPGNTHYFNDFTVFLSDGTVEFIDTKGKMTASSNLKIKQVEDLYPVTIKIITAKDF